jgi:hypothetical protein
MKKSLAACAALAAVASPLAHAAPEWSFTPYAWIAGFDGTIGVAGGDSGLGERVNVDFSSLSDNMKLGGFMLNGSWRDGRWTAFGDWTYAKVESDSPTRVPNLYGSVDAEVKGNVVQGNVGYSLIAQAPTHLDAYVGVRFYDIDIKTELKGGVAPEITLRGDAQWADAVVGARWTTRFAGPWEAFAQADVGGGGSDLSWQAIGAIGYRWNWGAIFAGYRYLKVDYNDGPYTLDAALAGPLVGANFRW